MSEDVKEVMEAHFSGRKVAAIPTQKLSRIGMLRSQSAKNFNIEGSTGSRRRLSDVDAETIKMWRAEAKVEGQAAAPARRSSTGSDLTGTTRVQTPGQTTPDQLRLGSGPPGSPLRALGARIYSPIGNITSKIFGGSWQGSRLQSSSFISSGKDTNKASDDANTALRRSSCPDSLTSKMAWEPEHKSPLETPTTWWVSPFRMLLKKSEPAVNE